MKTLDPPCRTERIYLDYNASTPIHAAVVAASIDFNGDVLRSRN